jgi:MSHA biogenesis protein MshI
MQFFRRASKDKGWMTVALLSDGITVARVDCPPDGKPVVRLAAFFAHGTVDAAALEKAGREANAASFRIATMLGGREYQVVTVESPNVPAEELRSAVRWRLKDMLDFPADTATIDILTIPVAPSAAGRAANLFVVAARNSLIEERQNMFVEAKLDMQVIDVPEMAQRNLSALLAPENRGLAMLSFGEDGGLLTITYNGELYLSRRLEVGLAQILEQDHDRKHASFDKITLELQRSLDHFDRQYNFVSVAKLMLAPTGASGLEEYLSANMYVPVETCVLADMLDLEQQPALLGDVAAQQRFFLTLGAAMRVPAVAP